MSESRALTAVPEIRSTPSVPFWTGVTVPPAHALHVEYVPIHDIVCHATYSQLYPAEVERAYRRQLELGDHQGWPPPTGYWRDDGRFVLTDGRNRYVAALMLGFEHLLVAWLAPPASDVRRDLS